MKEKALGKICFFFFSFFFNRELDDNIDTLLCLYTKYGAKLN